MTAKPETAAEVLAEMRQQTRDGWTSDGRLCQFADRLERALSAQSQSYDALLLIAQSTVGALERAGVTDCDDPGEAIDVLRERWERALSAQGEALRHLVDSPEDRFEQFVQAEIARSPEPLRELGEYLADALDEDKFPRANALLLQLATSYTHLAPARVTEEMVDSLRLTVEACNQPCLTEKGEREISWAVVSWMQSNGPALLAALSAALEADHG